MYSLYFLYSFFITQHTTLGTSSDMGKNAGHQLIKVILTKLSIFIDRHHFSLSWRIALSYEKQFQYAKYVPSRCLRFTKSFFTLDFLLLRSKSGKNCNTTTGRRAETVQRYRRLDDQRHLEPAWITREPYVCSWDSFSSRSQNNCDING